MKIFKLVVESVNGKGQIVARIPAPDADSACKYFIEGLWWEVIEEEDDGDED